MTSVVVKMKVVSKTQEAGYQQLADGSTPNRNTINFEVVSTGDVNSPNFPYSFWSSGTKFPLMTINQTAADGLILGEEYDITINPSA